ncbi:hypothetical protein [Mycobacterium conspicuum]|nr:hypothetical protein [Mycobacterium conspicuum]
MMHRGVATAIALCGAAAALAIGTCYGPGEDPPAAPSPSVTVSSAPDPGGRDGAFPAIPAGGGGVCIVGLNCGCIPRVTCPTPRRRARTVVPGTDASRKPNP